MTVRDGSAGLRQMPTTTTPIAPLLSKPARSLLLTLLFTNGRRSVTGPNASDYGRALTGFAPDIERSADGLETIGHAL